MLFFMKRSTGDANRSGKDACLSIIGLFSAIIFIGGLTGLIYGIIKGSLVGIIAGGSAIGVAVFLMILFILLIACCFKTNNRNLQ